MELVIDIIVTYKHLYKFGKDWIKIIWVIYWSDNLYLPVGANIINNSHKRAYKKLANHKKKFCNSSAEQDNFNNGQFAFLGDNKTKMHCGG